MKEMRGQSESMTLLQVILLAAASSLALVAQAQESETDDEAEVVEEIVVVGYRDSLRRNLAIKRDADAIVDAVSAEDIGQFPDINVADALQRVTGVQVEKDERDGEGVRVSIRGTPSHLNLALLNGQQIATGTASNRRTELRDRSFNYYLLPTEIVDTLEVYKSPEASIEEGSMGGTVIVRTRKPLDADANSGAASARFFHFENADENQPHISGLYNWKNLDETFGVNVAYVYRDSATLMDSKRNTAGYFGLIDYNGDGETHRLPARVGANRYDADRSLSTPFVTLQFAPSDDLDISLTALNSITETESQGIYSFGFNIQGLFGRPHDFVTGYRDGTAISGNFIECCSTVNWGSSVYDTGLYQDEVETTAFNLEATLDRGNYTVTVQAGHSFADGMTIDKAGQFYAPSTLSFDMSSGIMEHTVDADLMPDDYQFHYSHINTIRNDSDSTFVQADAEFMLNNDFFPSIEAGIKYRDYNKGASRVKRDFVEEGTLAQFASGGRATDFEVGAVPMQMWHFDIAAFEAWQNGIPEVAGTGNSSWNDPNDRYEVNEEVTSAYIQGNFETSDFRGNIGLRYVSTSTEAEASRYTGANFRADRNDLIRPAVTSNDYTDILPSLNVAYVGVENLVLRFAAAEVMARPNYVSIAPFETRNCGSRGCTAFEGNPDLEPYRSTQLDLSAEFYFNDSSLLAFTLFTKDVDSYIDLESFTDDRLYWTLDGDNNVVEETRTFTIERPINGEGLTIDGFEINYQQDIAYGFGVTANYTNSEADITPTEALMDAGREAVFFGHSEDTWNATVYYEGYGLAARLSYTFRSEYASNHLAGANLQSNAQTIGAVTANNNELGIGPGVSRGLIGYKGDFGQLDFNASYYVMDNVEVLFQAINLGDEEIEWYASREDHTADQGRPIGLYNHGRRFAVGVNVKF